MLMAVRAVVISVSKAELFIQISSVGSSLEDSGHISHNHPPSYFTMLDLELLNNGIFYTIPCLNLQKAYGLNEGPPIL